MAGAGGGEVAQPPPETPKVKVRAVEIWKPGSFEPSAHFYPRVLNAQIHPLVRSFLSIGNDRIAKRYTHLHPEASKEAVEKALTNCCRYFQWGGADLFSTTTARGQKRFVVVETNSCPSGQKSMPLVAEDLELAGYKLLLEKAFMPVYASGKFNGLDLPDGKIAVLWDKNKMEASGYAAALADLTGQEVYVVPFFADDPAPAARFRSDGVLEIRTSGAVHKLPAVEPVVANGASAGKTNGEAVLPQAPKASEPPPPPPPPPASVAALEPEKWEPVRAALRYVTQRPWSRMPPVTRTFIFNPVLACLAGGRNKMLAAKAYDLHNAELSSTGLSIFTPETIWDVAKPEVPLWVGRMGGLAVVKVPYANAGQGVWTITHQAELKAFMEVEHRYDRFIVQSLVGNHGWSSLSTGGRLYHVGTVPDSKGNIYAADLRLMIGSSPQGFFPVAIYARRARVPLTEELEAGAASWDMLGTNLSFKAEDGSWGTETERLLLMDSRDFNRIGIGIDDLIEAYMQTVLAVTAIDRLACKLITPKGKFGLKLFQSLNPDPKLLGELYPTELDPPMEPPLPPLETGIGSRKSSPSARPVEGDENPVDNEDSLAAELQMKVEDATPQAKKRKPMPVLAVGQAW